MADTKPHWVLVFGSETLLRAAHPALVQAFAGAVLMGCSTAGEISGEGVTDDALTVTAIRWDATTVQHASTDLQNMGDSFDAGMRLGAGLPRKGLRAVVVLGQGVHINGSALIQGLSNHVGGDIPIVGGLAGDGGAFVRTAVLDMEGVSPTRLVCAGLYGDRLHVAHGVQGGWSPFGPARRVSKARHNVLYSLDGEAALETYKRYLGDHAKDLPASGLLFPFSVVSAGHQDDGLLRTILGIDEAEGSIILAGDVQEGAYLRMMQASTDALVRGAEQAAAGLPRAQAQGLALLVSCVGRKLVMGGRVDEELEAVSEALGDGATLAGFYSYGEISPTHPGAACLLHNQTMTITHFSEVA